MTDDGTVTIGTLGKEKEALEIDLLKYINERVREFKKETNCSPFCINVSMRDVTSVGDARWQYEVDDVEVEVRLF